MKLPKGVYANKNKSGEIISYRFKTFTHTDVNGVKQFYDKNYTPPAGLSDSKLEKWLYARKVQHDEQAQHARSTVPLRLREFIPEYLALIAADHAPRTVDSYRKAAERYILPSLGHLKLTEIKPVHVQQFVLQLQEPENGQYLSPGSIKRYYAVLQSILTSACKLDLIPVNPADSSKITLPRQEHQETAVFTPEELSQLFDCLTGEPLKYQLLVQLAFASGARRGELIALQWDHVHLDTQPPYIDIALSNYKLTGEEVKSKEPKSRAGIRKIALPESVAQLLRNYRIEQIKRADALGDAWDNPVGWVFTTPDGAPMHPDTITKWFSKFLKKNGIPHRKFHALRHTSGTLALENGASIKAVAARLGHAQLSTTNIYLHGLQSADAAIADSFESLIGGSSKNKTG